MIKIFTGENRAKALTEIKKLLGDDYEVIEGADLAPEDLPSLLKGASLFAETRNILIRDLSPNKATFDKLPEYLDTPHNVIIQEINLDKRSNTYKNLKDQIEIVNFALPESSNLGIIFNIYSTAKIDGKRAVEMLEKIEPEEDPIKFCGLLISQALKDYRKKQGTKEKKALKELSKLDLNLKSTSYQPWLLVRAFLLQLSSL